MNTFVRFIICLLPLIGTLVLSELLVLTLPESVGTDACMIIYGIASLTIAALIYYFVCKEKRIEHPIRAIGIKGWILVLLLAIGVEVLLRLVLVVFYLIAPDILTSYNELMDVAFGDLSILTIIYVGIAGPIAEELIFRGITFKLARKCTHNFWLANIIQAALFGIAHLNIVQGCYAFIFGLFLGYLYRKYNSLYVTMGAHILVNSLSLLIVFALSGITEEMGTTLLIGAVVLLILLAAPLLTIISIQLIKQDKKSHEREALFFEKYAHEYPLNPVAAAAISAEAENTGEVPCASESHVDAVGGKEIGVNPDTHDDKKQKRE